MKRTLKIFGSNGGEETVFFKAPFSQNEDMMRIGYLLEISISLGGKEIAIERKNDDTLEIRNVPREFANILREYFSGIEESEWYAATLLDEWGLDVSKNGLLPRERVVPFNPANPREEGEKREELLDSFVRESVEMVFEDGYFSQDVWDTTKWHSPRISDEGVVNDLSQLYILAGGDPEKFRSLSEKIELQYAEIAR